VPLPDARFGLRPQHVASGSTVIHEATYMFIDYRPLAAVLAALATCATFVILDALLRYAAH
jgi:hypothetical protein